MSLFSSGQNLDVKEVYTKASKGVIEFRVAGIANL